MDPLLDFSLLPAESTNEPAGERIVLPVLKEEIIVDKLLRETGIVSIRKTVRETEELIEENVAAETIDVERVPVDFVVATPPAIRVEGDVTIIPVLKEFLVVTKQLRVVEEVRITRRTGVFRQTERLTLRAEEVDVQRTPGSNQIITRQSSSSPKQSSDSDK